jgi:dTDP-4-dehydrorhamnose 3,5-epimerase
MQVIPTELPGLLIVEPQAHTDARGYLVETWNHARYAAAGIDEPMRQDNLSLSLRGVLRGLHYQQPRYQAKLIGVARGEIFDVAVDIRVGSPTFGRWFGLHLSGENLRQLFIPAGFAHGFCVLSESALVAYKCSQEYDPAGVMTIRWNDPRLAIDWPIGDPTLSESDAAAPTLDELAAAQLPQFDARIAHR